MDEPIVFSKINLGGSGSSDNLEKKDADQNNNLQDAPSKEEKNNLKKSHKKRTLFIVLFAVFILFSIKFALLFNVYLKAKKFYEGLSLLRVSLVEKDLDKINSSLNSSQKQFNDLKNSYSLISWMRFFPFLGSYVSDFGHLINAGDYTFQVANEGIEVLGPHLDLLGFKGSSLVKSGATSDKIAFITEALPEVLPKIDPIVSKLSLIRKEINQINSNRYPVSVGNKQVRSRIENLLKDASDVISVVETSEPLIQKLPYILGIDSPRSYLLLFQNDKELRPTGGFMTAYAVMKVDKATFEPVSSNDIYNLDSKYKPSIPAPDPLIKYLKGPYVLSKNFRLRDLNWSADFEDSMNIFVPEIEKTGIDSFDAIIAVDTQFLVSLLDVIGEIQVPGYGAFSNKIVPQCNCPQVIYELESFADVEGPIVWDQSGNGKIIYAPPNWLNRKKIIGPLMNSIAAYSLGQPSEKLPELFNVFLNSLEQKHILVYFKEEDVQKAARDFKITGNILDFDGDYLYINDANLGGRKSNLYVTQEVSQEVFIGKDGYIEKHLLITYKNPEKHDGWLNSVLPNWVRIYIPKGSQIISVNGIQDFKNTYDEAGKSVVAGFFELRPQGIAKVEVKYRLPFKADGKKYQIFIQKQPGKDSPLYTISFGKKTEEIYLKKDTLLTFDR
jgi:hypothetical protein